MSSNEFAIRVEAVSKRFEIFEHPRDQLKQFVYPRLRRLLRRPSRNYFKEFWALREIFLEVRKGESCAICLLYTSPSPRDLSTSRMPSSA